VVSVQYIGKKGTHLYFAGNNNLDALGPQVEKLSPTQIGNLGNYVNNPFASVLTGSYYANSGLSSPTVQAFQLQLPFPQFAGVTTDEPPSANSIFNALQIVVEKRYSNGLQLSANYTWSNTIHHGSYCQLSLMQKMSLSLPDVVRAELIGQLTEVACEPSTPPIQPRIVSDEKVTVAGVPPA
jgi:hypothetical protein